jgi:hypothetical protein
MKNTPRVRAFFDFIVEELHEVRTIISGRLTPSADARSQS